MKKQSFILSLYVYFTLKTAEIQYLRDFLSYVFILSFFIQKMMLKMTTKAGLFKVDAL